MKLIQLMTGKQIEDQGKEKDNGHRTFADMAIHFYNKSGKGGTYEIY